MSDYYYVLVDGKTPVKATLLEWAEWSERADRQVAIWTQGDVQVSTVFLGLDHSFGQGESPLLFETMIFGGPFDLEQDRYTTWQEAEAGHKVMVKRVEDG